MAALRQKVPPTARANPVQGGAAQAGGTKKGDITGKLSTGQMGAIADQLRADWTYDAGALDAEKRLVTLRLKLDAGGVVREVRVEDEDMPKMSDKRFQVFAERAVRAAMSPRVGPLKVPKELLFDGAELLVRWRPQ